MATIDYKEKLRLAKEALESGSYDKETIEYIFPELAESEDERIRKELIAMVKLSCTNGDDVDKKIAWLEKQGKTSPVLSNSSNIGKDEQKPDDNIESMTQSYITPNQKFFQWIYDRLIYVHDENPSVDYMLSLKERIKDMQKPAWSEEDKINLEKAIWYVENPAPMVVKDSMLVEWLKFLKERVQPQPKQEWNEEDKEMIGNIRTIIEKYAFSQSAVDVNGDLCEKEYIDADNWLKNLYKVQSQQEWSEEDIATISRVISIVKWAAYSDHSHPILNDKGATELVERLNSLKERYTWKPSKEQIETLSHMIDAVEDEWVCEEPVGRELLEQLKKLRGE